MKYATDHVTHLLADAVLNDDDAVQRVIKIYQADDISAHTIRVAFGAARHEIDVRTVTNAQYYGAYKLVIAQLFDTTSQLAQDNTMSNVDNTKAIQDVTYIFGRDITTLSAADLIAAIERIQNDNEVLTRTGVDSKYIKAQVKSNNDTIAQLVAKLDALA